MKSTLLTLLALAALTAPAPAAAQPPDRGRTVIRERAAAERTAVQQARNRQEQTERTTRTLKIGAAGELSVSNIAGDIVVTRGGGSDAQIEIVKTGRGRTPEEAREMLGLVSVDVVERAGRAEVKTRYPDFSGVRDNRRNVNVSVAYTISAPAGTRLTVRSISGNIRVGRITGDLQLESVSGNVQVDNAGRISGAKSISGNVEIVDTEVDGGLEAATVSGTAIARRVKARRISLGSVSGNVVMESVQSERAEAQSMSGNVEFSGPLSAGGRYEMQSHSGDVHVNLTGKTGFELEATTFGGSVRADGLELTLRSGGADRRGRHRELHGVVGDGSAVLEITSFSGNVVVSRR